MANSESLDNVLCAAFKAVLEAQKLAEGQHIDQLKHYSEKDGKPKLASLYVPDLQTTTPDDLREIKVPHLALVPPTGMSIDTLTMKFKIDLIGFADPPEEKKTPPGESKEKPTDRGPLSCEFHGESAHGSSAEIGMTFEKTAPPEAYRRIADLLSSVVS